MSANETARIRELNDAFRRAPELSAQRASLNRLCVTRGVADHGPAFMARALARVRSFEEFTPGDDPYQEHDFGAFTLDGERLFWKIDCYDLAGAYHSPDPADPLVTRRVLTIMLASEY
ncbi:MAG: DUF3768 domain-containing protein [Vicinamibacterales bacterium]